MKENKQKVKSKRNNLMWGYLEEDAGLLKCFSLLFFAPFLLLTKLPTKSEKWQIVRIYLFCIAATYLFVKYIAR